jgi:menaquinone-specific isochorismate synthase
MSRTSARWRARTVPLAAAPDLLVEAGDRGVLWRSENGGLAGRGTAVEIDMPGGLSDPASLRAVREALASIETTDEVGLPGCGPVAVGALPFDPSAPGRLVVPSLIVGHSGDTGWLTTVEPVDGTSPVPAEAAGAELRLDAGPGADAEEWGGAAEKAEPAGVAGLSPDEFNLVSSMPHAEWREVVAAAIKRLGRGELRKVVLARRVEITANRSFVIPDVLERLTALYPSCMIFSVDGFLGASPELLISREGELVQSHPLAGTVARSGDSHADQALVAGLMSSGKARHEHQVVVDALVEVLAPLCRELTVPNEPTIMGLRNVSHLGTHISGRLTAGGSSPPSALELVAMVHPTPAVGGSPTEAAIRYLQQVEGFDRGLYAGPVGWVDTRGDGAWAIGIRCADVDANRAHIYAGNGIVAGSDPAEELAETQLKLQALLAALVRP